MRSIKSMKKVLDDSFKDALADATEAASSEEDTFRSALENTLDSVYNIRVTENGAVGFDHTESKLLDINYMVSSLRNQSQWKIASMFKEAYDENRLLAVKWLFFAGDVRGGLGERRLFRTCLRYLAFAHRDTARAVLPLVAEYTRWDNLFCLIDSPLEGAVIAMVKKQLWDDCQNMKAGRTVSLLAKWMPSVNASSVETRCLAKTLAKKMHMTERWYRKMLSGLRAYMKVVEVSMSSGRWDTIDYPSVPSRANLIYGEAFLRHDTERRKDYLCELIQGKKDIHAGVLFPHDIVSKYDSCCRNRKYGKYSYGNMIAYDPYDWCDSYDRYDQYDETMESLWKALPDYVEGNDSTICVADGSASMFAPVGRTKITCLQVANALAIYFAERCSGAFKDTYITFSGSPRLVDLSQGSSLLQKIQIARRHNEMDNTNIEAVFELILDTAVGHQMKQEDMPKNILILSDMEFDSCAVSNSKKVGRRRVTKRLFEVLEQKYRDAGYQLPRLIFWNLCSRTGTIPMVENDLGVALVSGFSPSIMRMVLDDSLEPGTAKTQTRISPMACLVNRLNSERYDAVEQALRSA